MKVFRKINRKSIKLNPDYSLVEAKIPSTIDAYFKVTDPSVLKGSGLDVEIKYPEWRKNTNYIITDITIQNNEIEVLGVLLGSQLPCAKFEGIEITIKQNYIYTFADPRRYLYSYSKMPNIRIKCHDCKSTFYYQYMEDDYCPVCDSYVDHGIEIEYEEFNENMYKK